MYKYLYLYEFAGRDTKNKKNKTNARQISLITLRSAENTGAPKGKRV